MASGPEVAIEDGRLSIIAERYRLAVDRADRPYARLSDADGRIWADVLLIGNVATLDGPDDWFAIDPPTIDGPVIRWPARSARWASAELVLAASDHVLRCWLEVVGTGALTDVELFAGWMSARPQMGTGRFESGRRFAAIVPGGPDDPARVWSPASEVAGVGVVGGSPPGRGRWFFTPGALAFAVAQGRGATALDPPAGPWLGIGLDAELDINAGFTSFEYVPGDGSFGLRVRYEGHTRVDGPWRSPAVTLAPGLGDPYRAIGATTRARRRSTPSSTASPSRPGWWLEPMFCGWGAQVAAGAEECLPPGELARQDRYDAWLARLADAGIVPGTVVVDDKWQRTYGGNAPDPAKWPDLRSWIAERRANDQRVLLWWKAWDFDGLRPEACVQNAAGIPVAADPSSPVYEAILRASVRSMLGEGPDQLAADGLKIDFTAQTPSGASLTTAAERDGRPGPWGVALLHRLLAIVADEARRVRPDALLITHAPDPLFHDVTSMLRLNDLLRLDDPEPLQPVVAQARHRARLVRAVTDDIPIDTDDWAMPSKAEWLAWQRAKVEVGVPALYHVDRVAGETIDDADLAEVRDAWAAYRRRTGLPQRSGTSPSHAMARS
jgi:hypothetical protein